MQIQGSEDISKWDLLENVSQQDSWWNENDLNSTVKYTTNLSCLWTWLTIVKAVEEKEKKTKKYKSKWKHFYLIQSNF